MRLSLLLLATGCAGKVPSVRAERRFAREPSRIGVVRERIEDVEKSVRLSRTLLVDVPYAPGDPWPSRLAMSDEEEDRIESQLRHEYPYRDRDLQVPPLSIWLRHVERVIETARSEPGDDRAPGIVQAIGAMPGGARIAELLADFDAEGNALAAAGARVALLRQASRAASTEAEIRETASALSAAERDLDDARARSGEIVHAIASAARDLSGDRRLLRDLQSVVSAAYRLAAEAGALRAVLEREEMLALPRPDRATRQRLRTTARVLDHPESQAVPIPGTPQTVSLPLRMGAATARAAATEKLTERLGRALDRPARRDLDDAPGLATGDTLVDDVAGFAFESFALHARAGGDVTFFSNLVDQTTDPESDSDVRFDYTGRRQYLRYHVQPIVLFGASGEASVSLFSLPKFLRLKFSWATDRWFRSGGQVDKSSSAVTELGIEGRVSDLVEAILHAGGIDTGIRIARFDFGEVDVVNARSGRVVDTFPFQLEELQLDVAYDLRHFIDAAWLVGLVDSIDVGFRYVEYRLPRILYEMEDQNPDPDQDEYTLVGETDFVQNLEATYYLGGFRIQTFDDPSTTSRLVLDFGFYFGAGPAELRYPGPRDVRHETLLALIVPMRLGYRLPLLPASSVFQLDVVAAYDASLVHANTMGEGAQTASGEGGGSDQGTRVIRFGSTDFFHGPSVWLKGSL